MLLCPIICIISRVGHPRVVHRGVEQVPEGVKLYIGQVVFFENSFEMTVDSGVSCHRLSLDTGEYPAHRAALQSVFLEQGLEPWKNRHDPDASVFRPLVFSLAVLHINVDCM